MTAGENRASACPRAWGKTKRVEEDLEQPFPRLEIDAVELRRQQQRLLAAVFGTQAEVPLLNHYELLYELGRGSMGVVHAAHDRRLDRKVAIKTLVAGRDPELRQRLIREAQIMAKLAHPNVVPVYEIGELEDTTFIVMACVDGVGLRSWLDQAPRGTGEILAVFRAAGEGLAAAHAKGLVHRDFKPDNVMVGDDGQVWVMDFGVARSVHAGDGHGSPVDGPGPWTGADTSMTQTGALVGTPAYMAPEQLRGGWADAASDQFAFCVALYEALYGARPFVGATLHELRAVVEAGELPPPPSSGIEGTEVPAWLRAIVARGLSSDAGQRFESMRALLDAIESEGDRGSWLADEARLAGVPAHEFSPYRGLEAFRECDARWMFGRERETGELVERVRSSASRLLCVVGGSGSGKSSLVMAGLCPALRRGALGADLSWEIAVLRPGARPCESLARALIELRAEAGEPVRDADVDQLGRALLDHTSTLAKTVGDLVAVPTELEPRQRRVLLVVDQLEELFTEAGLRPGYASPEVAAFLDNLITATRGRTELWVVATLRADFVHRCLELRSLARVLHAGTHLVLAPMTKREIQAAIEQPASRVGYEVDPTLVAELVNAAAENPGRLPLLQHVLRELWLRRDADARRLCYAAYEATGGLEGAIAVAADAALDQLRRELGEQADDAVRRVMTRLVHPGEVARGDTRRRATRDELGADPRTTQVLTAFVSEARVLVASEVGGVEVIELAHEALLREWSKLVEWLDIDRDALRLRHELAQGADQYAAHTDPEYLWGKGRVEEATRVLGQSTVELGDVERRFLERSIARVRKRERWVRISVAAAFVVLIVFSGFTLGLALENQRQASDYQALADAELAQRARADDGLNAQKGLRASMLAEGRIDVEAVALAIEALGAYGPPFVRPPPADVYQGTLDALAMRGIVGPVAALEAHTRSVVAVAYSADGQTLATGSRDGSARLWDASSGQPLAVLDGHTRSVTSVAFSPDGSRLATGSWDHSARVWDVDSGSQLAQLEGHRDDVVEVVFSPDGARVATASSDDSARIWDADSGALIHTLEGHEGNVSAVAFSPDGARVATASHDATARIWDAHSGAALHELAGHHSRMLDVAFSPDGARLVTCGYEGVARIWEVTTGTQLVELDAHRSSVVAAVFSPDGSRLATASFDDTARVWDPDSGELLASFTGHTDDVLALAFVAGGARLVTGSADATVRVWDARSGRELAALAGHTDDVLAVAVHGSGFTTTSADATARIWSLSGAAPRPRLEGHAGNVAALRYAPDGARLASAGDDASVRVWDPSARRQLHALDGHTNGVTALAFSPDGARLASAGYDSSVRLWDVVSGSSLAVFEGHSSHVVALAFSPNGLQLASASYDATARLWGTQSHEPLGVFEGHASYVVALAFSPDGSRLATASYDSSVRVWDVNFGDQLAVLEGHRGYVGAVAFSGDGSTIASAGWDRSARLWSASSGAQLHALEGHGDRVLALAFTPDGTQLATAGADHVARLWDVDSGRLAQTFVGHRDDVVVLDLSPDGTRLATASVDDSVRVWELSSGRQLAKLTGHTGDVEQVVFSPDGSYLASAGAGGSVILWPLPAQALRLACDRVAPYLTRDRVATICGRLP
ncbi:nSTAND1 domain-containing NTPase [Enhygromyxa salina]|uniref:Serine/threonine-protein kinase PknB n=1 Tax=Enhygromyxa salina TaxID=215803 RepID=A0A2S9YNL4_9BACT|nr:protein kinase [Enhygromyxa salina]PRQ06677.1 Serine/threonine-protein kinase PknB [Enhygromyxa salina]